MRVFCISITFIIQYPFPSHGFHIRQKKCIQFFHKQTFHNASMRSLTGKVAIISGGNSGIGEATAIELCNRGAAVVFFGRRHELGCLVEKKICKRGGKCTWIKADVTKPEYIYRFIESIKSGLRQFYGSLRHFLRHFFFQNCRTVTE